jgi:hypothetical protein
LPIHKFVVRSSERNHKKFSHSISGLIVRHQISRGYCLVRSIFVGNSGIEINVNDYLNCAESRNEEQKLNGLFEFHLGTSLTIDPTSKAYLRSRIALTLGLSMNVSLQIPRGTSPNPRAFQNC